RADVLTSRGERVVAAGKIDEADGGERRRIVVIGREVGRQTGHDRVTDERGAGEVGGDRRHTYTDPVVAEDPVEVVGHDVVHDLEGRARDEPRLVGRRDHVAGLYHGVVIDDDVGAAVHDLEERAVAAPGGAHIVEEIVLDLDALCLLAGAQIVGGQDIHGRPGVAHDVVRERDVPHGRPGRGSVLVANGEEDAETILGVRPVVLEQV